MTTAFTFHDVCYGLLPENGFSFELGCPNSTSLKKVSAFMEKSMGQLKKHDRYELSLQYGCDMGHEAVRQQVANFLQRGYRRPVDKDDLFMTCGASASLEMILTHFFTSNHTMFVEDPTYAMVTELVKNHHYIKGDYVPLRDDGIDLKILEEKVKCLPDIPLTERHPFRAAVYVIPVFHNPTGICYSAEKCDKLIELARKYDLMVISDDVYNFLHYYVRDDDDASVLPPSIFAHDRRSDPGYAGGHVVSNGSFSKIAGPGLRLGWLEAPRRVVAHLDRWSYQTNSGGALSYYVSHLFANVLESGDLDKYIVDLRRNYRNRMEVFIYEIESGLGDRGVSVRNPGGGYFLWVKFPEWLDAEQVLLHARTNENLTFVPGVRASSSGNFRNYVRLSFAYYEADEIATGAKRFCRAVEQVMQKTEKMSN